MATDKKKKKKASLKFRHVIIPILIIAVAILLGFIIGNKVSKMQYYGCTEYTTSTVTTGDPIEDNLFEDYEYYRLYLGKDGIFTLKYKFVNGTKTYTEEGTYTITEDGKKLTLSYKDFADELAGDAVYTLTAKNTWSRDQYVKLSESSRFTVVQTFVLGKN